MKIIAILFALLFFSACSSKDDNDIALYGEKSGLPKNCRAYVQYAIDAYRAKKYDADATFEGLERNCGDKGHAWKNLRGD